MKSQNEHSFDKQLVLSSDRDNKKEWKKPLITELDLQDTKGGFFPVNFEAEPWFLS